MNFVCFLLLNAVLLLRPDDFLPELKEWRLYLIVILICTLVSLPRLLELLTPSSLRRRPVAVCVLLYFASILITLCTTNRIDLVPEYAEKFGKMVLYYFLFLAVVDTPNRFRTFVATLVLLIGVVSVVAVAQYNGWVYFTHLIPYDQIIEDPTTGERIVLPRMVSAGMFNDPNDLCLLLGLGIWCCIYRASTSELGLAGWLLWLIPVPMFAIGVAYTHSRGGLMGVVAGGVAYLYARFGNLKMLPFLLVGGVAALLLVGGRQSEVSGGTAHTRLMFWADGFSAIFQQPFRIPTGLGLGWFTDETGHVAHNSFVQAYVEQGVFGGAAFFSAFLLAVWLIDRVGRGVNAPEWVIRARPFALAAVVGYAVGCYSLTRNMAEPTYLILGLASTLLEHAAPTLPSRYQVSGRWLAFGLIVGLCGLLTIKLITQALCMAGV